MFYLIGRVKNKKELSEKVKVTDEKEDGLSETIESSDGTEEVENEEHRRSHSCEEDKNFFRVKTNKLVFGEHTEDFEKLPDREEHQEYAVT